RRAATREFARRAFPRRLPRTRRSPGFAFHRRAARLDRPHDHRRAGAVHPRAPRRNLAGTDRGRIGRKMIPLSSLERTAEALMAKAAIEIPDDYLEGVRRCANTETGELSAFVLQAMLENYEAAKHDRRAMCGDTGVPRWYVKIGNEARVEGGPVALEAALRRATARATTSVPLRPNRVHPLWRIDHNNNIGINAPEIEYAFHPDADWIELT